MIEKNLSKHLTGDRKYSIFVSTINQTELRMKKKVKEMIRLVEADGWCLKGQRGSHRQYTHLEKHGKVTIAGKESDTLPHKTVKSILEQAGL